MMSMFRDLVDLLGVVTPYLLHPLTALGVFLPHTWPISWFIQSGAFVPKRDVPVLKDKVILVTGGNGALGKESIYQLALSSPARIYLTARTRAKGEAAIRDILERLRGTSGTVQPDIAYLELDLSDLQSVHDAAKIVLSQESRLDVLMLNAGIMATPSSMSKSGHEMQLCTNHIGHFLLTRLLLPLLQHTALHYEDSDVRVVTVSSVAHHMAPSNFLDMIEEHDQLSSAGPHTLYGISKAANVVFAAELARRYDSEKITSVSVHPGMIHTDLFVSSSKSNFVLRFVVPVLAHLFFDDVKHGALNQIWCAVGAKKDELVNGAYYTPVGRIMLSPLAHDEASGERLWNWTTKQVVSYID